MSKSTKTVQLTQEFLRAAAGNEESALAYQFFAAFGTSLRTSYDEVVKAIKNKDSKIIALMMAAAVQVRGNVVFVGANYGNIRAIYPSLVIEGTRAQGDIFNFGALHVCGHIVAAMTKNPLGSRISNKAGNCVVGGGFTDTDAGKINKEIFGSWPVSEAQEVAGLISSFRGGDTTALDTIVFNMDSLRKSFAAKLSPTSGKAPDATTG